MVRAGRRLEAGPAGGGAGRSGFEVDRSSSFHTTFFVNANDDKPCSRASPRESFSALHIHDPPCVECTACVTGTLGVVWKDCSWECSRLMHSRHRNLLQVKGKKHQGSRAIDPCPG